MSAHKSPEPQKRAQRLVCPEKGIWQRKIPEVLASVKPEEQAFAQRFLGPKLPLIAAHAITVPELIGDAGERFFMPEESTKRNLNKRG